ncbi:hypothetical protein MTO96_014009 [Rhipicephalus appendiculatus]
MMGAFYSSGTTGVAKRVAISHRQWIAQLLATRELAAGQIGPGDLVLCAPSLTHISGLWLFCGCLTLGVPLLLLPSFDAALLVPAVRKHKVTTIMIYPSYLRNLIDNAPSEAFESVDKVFIGGSTAPRLTVTRGARQVSASSLYPTGLRSHRNLWQRDIDGTEELRIRERGEASSNGAAKRDVGFYDAEGNVYVTGRLKELIKCMELQIEPAEIERLLLQEPDVLEALVVGVPHQRFGEAARAFVVLRNGRPPARDVEGRLRRAVAEVLPNHEHLHGGIEFVDHIPKSETGKSIRSALRDAHIQRQATLSQ